MPSPAELERLYADREVAIQALAAKGAVEPDDLTTLDRLGRCRVADELWGICTEQVRQQLLVDQHHSVCSIALISASRTVAP